MAPTPHHKSPYPKRVHQLTHPRPSRLAAATTRSKPLPRTPNKTEKTNSKPPEKIREVEDDINNIMASGFLQYCTYCESQIVVPSQSVLYCSERCRRRDNNKTISPSSLHAEASPPPSSPRFLISFDDLPAHDIVPQRSPTSISITRPDAHTGDEDSIPEDQSRSADRPHDSEAARYLRQFHSLSATDLPTRFSRTRSTRPQYTRASTSTGGGSSTGGAPSLSQSPMSIDELSYSYSYTTPSTRPLPRRADPFSCSSCGAKNSDLVNPFAVVPPQIVHTAPSSFEVHQQQQQGAWSLKTRPSSQICTDTSAPELMSYEKSAISPPPSGSLKQLFRFNEMQAPPTSAELSQLR